MGIALPAPPFIMSTLRPSLLLESDPIFAGIKVGHSIGILAIEFATIYSAIKI
jgi:hypothetical protein